MRRYQAHAGLCPALHWEVSGRGKERRLLQVLHPPSELGMGNRSGIASRQTDEDHQAERHHDEDKRCRISQDREVHEKTMTTLPMTKWAVKGRNARGQRFQTLSLKGRAQTCRVAPLDATLGPVLGITTC